MHANGRALDGNVAAVNRRNRRLGRELSRTCSHVVWRCHEGIGATTGNQLAVRQVRTVGKPFGYEPHTHLFRQRLGARCRQAKECELVVQRKINHDTRVIVVRHHHVVQRTMRLHVCHRCSNRARHLHQGIELFAQRVRQRCRIDLHGDTTEVRPIGVRHLCSYRHTEPSGLGTHLSHRRFISGVPPTRNVRTRDEPQ